MKTWGNLRVRFTSAITKPDPVIYCVSGVSDARFLVASHIVAWKEDASIRLNPANGLCLSTIHDKAFDNHLFR